MTTFLNPTLIQLADLDFQKIDVHPGSAVFTQADFAVIHAGQIKGLNITLDRDDQELIKSTEADPITFYTNNGPTKFYVSDNTDTDISSSVHLNSNILTSQFHSNFNSHKNSADLIHGALFALIVKSIFQGIDTRSIDFSDSTVRSDNVFFQGDATAGNGTALSVVDDIALKTKAAFNATTSGITDEFEYWNVRTGIEDDLEQDTVPFSDDDVIYVYYKINTGFVTGSMGDLGYADFSELNALQATGTLLTPFSSVNVESTFVLSFDIQVGIEYSTYALGSTGSDNLQTAVNAWFTDETAATATYGHISTWNVSNVTDMEDLFKGRENWNDDISHWDVSNVTNMHDMFYGAKSFNQPLDTWDVSKVTDMSYMLRNCFEFNQPLNSWDVSNVRNMTNMFANAWVFNQDLSSWTVSGVTNMQRMFSAATVFNQSINTWDVSSVTNISHMFSEANAFNQPLDNWDVSNVTVMNHMFSGADAFNGTMFTLLPGNIVTNISYMFWNAPSFNQNLDHWTVALSVNINGVFGNTGGGSATWA